MRQAPAPHPRASVTRQFDNVLVGDEADVVTCVDGVYMSQVSGNFFKFNNVERVEVLKGPEGTAATPPAARSPSSPRRRRSRPPASSHLAAATSRAPTLRPTSRPA
jgi:hypothetical protein